MLIKFHIRIKEVFFLLIVVLSCVRSSDEFLEIIGKLKDDLSDSHDLPFSTEKINIAPDYPRNIQVKSELIHFIPELMELHTLFNEYMSNGVTSKYRTFNIYDTTQKDATVVLYHILTKIKEELLPEFYQYLNKHVNNEMVDYAQRLAVIYFHRENQNIAGPPFVETPYLFTNGEVLERARKIKMNGFNSQSDKPDIIYINSNYSGWNLPCNGPDFPFTYFREDIGLNSFYYGIHLLHPYWKPDEELNALNPRHAEHFYYSHQQLFTRYLLEKYSTHKYDPNTLQSLSMIPYNSYLRYENGLDFPMIFCAIPRHNISMKIVMDQMVMKETIDRGFVVMDNGERFNLTEENHTYLIMKLIRDSFDSEDRAKYVRALYGSHDYNADRYNPSPSTIHHPQTSLREPKFWRMIGEMVNLVWKYRDTLSPLNLLDYETDDYTITNINVPILLYTYFEPYQFDISNAMYNNRQKDNETRTMYTVRQKRLQHEPFTINFTVSSKVNKKVITRLFLGPSCKPEDCFSNHYKEFFELDSFRMTLREGENIFKWSPSTSKRLFNDDEFNWELRQESDFIRQNSFSIFKFPARLILPRGGFRFEPYTFFTIITDADQDEDEDNITIREASIKIHHECYKSVVYEHDKKPLGFPFLRKIIGYNKTASNYVLKEVLIKTKYQRNDIRNEYFIYE